MAFGLQPSVRRRSYGRHRSGSSGRRGGGPVPSPGRAGWDSAIATRIMPRGPSHCWTSAQTDNGPHDNGA